MADNKEAPRASKIPAGNTASPKPAKAAPAAIEAVPAVPVAVEAVQAAPKTESPEAAFEAYVQHETAIMNEGHETMTNHDTINQAAEATQDIAARTNAMFGQTGERVKTVAKTAMEKNVKLVEEVSELTKGNVEAIVASSKIAAKGVETLGQEVAEYSRKSFEDMSAALKSFAEVKSPTDFFRLQSDYARSAFDSMVAEGSKVSEAVIKLAGEVAEPITSRYTVAAERAKIAVNA